MEGKTPKDPSSPARADRAKRRVEGDTVPLPHPGSLRSDLDQWVRGQESSLPRDGWCDRLRVGGWRCLWGSVAAVVGSGGVLGAGFVGGFLPGGGAVWPLLLGEGAGGRQGPRAWVASGGAFWASPRRGPAGA